jgi:GR25 family glycosyltransferase involved in LPS biosynthesis
LEYIKDRNEHILNEIHKICTDDSKIHRIDAIKKDIGILGCVMSHIKALEYVLEHEWKTVLILEDDFTFKSNNINEKIKLLFEHNFDVGLLSHNFLKYSDTNIEHIKKVLYSQTTSSYIIKREYISVLLQNMNEGMNDMKMNGKRHENCLDIHWTKLQPIHNWYATFPAIGYQYDNYSDIENINASYGC